MEERQKSGEPNQNAGSKAQTLSSLSYTVPKGLQFTLFCNQLLHVTKNQKQKPQGSLVVRIWHTVIAIAQGSILVREKR